MAFRWRADDGPTLNAGLVVLRIPGDPVQYCKEFLYFCDFSDPLSPLWILAWHRNISTLIEIDILKFKTHFIVRIGFCTILCDRQVERERDACSVWICHFFNSGFQRFVFIFAKFFDRRDVLVYWVTVLHYKRHLRRWRASENVLVFWRKKESVAIHR